MGSQEVRVAPPNSLIFVADPTHQFVVPSDTGAGLVSATRSCISVGTKAEMDGDTLIKLASQFEFAG